jgi:hypothetical protein
MIETSPRLDVRSVTARDFHMRLAHHVLSDLLRALMYVDERDHRYVAVMLCIHPSFPNPAQNHPISTPVWKSGNGPNGSKVNLADVSCRSYKGSSSSAWNGCTACQSYLVRPHPPASQKEGS